MANPFPHGSGGYPASPDGTFNNFLPRIRNSPFTVLAGPNSPAASHPLSHLLTTPYEPSSDLYTIHPSAASRTMTADNHHDSSDRATPSMLPQTPQLPSLSRAFEPFMQNGSLEPPSRNDRPFVPSYLRGSSYIQKLDDRYRSQLAQKEAEKQQQSGSALPSGQSSTPLTSQTPSSHRGMKSFVIERAPPFDPNDSLSPLPSRWNREDKHGALDITLDGLELKNSGPRSRNEQDLEVWGIRADHPAPTQAGIYYYEVQIMPRKRDESTVCLGFSLKNVALSRPPGWEADSYGYHGDDGEAYSGHNNGKRFGQRFGVNDIVGCGINFRTRTLFFTKNGNIQGTSGFPFKPAKTPFPLYPAIGVKRAGEHIRVNFGQTPFFFDIDTMMEKEHAEINRAILATSLDRLVNPPSTETDLIQQLVLQFLQHDGYVEAARAFAGEIHAEKQALRMDQGTPVEGINIQDDEDAHCRQRIRRAVLEGDIDHALKYTNAYYPNVLKENSHVYFRLRCRKFIEMVRRSSDLDSNVISKSNGNTSDDRPNEMEVDGNGFSDEMDTEDNSMPLLEKAIEYGRDLQAEFRDDRRPDVSKSLNEIFSLMAYQDPSQVKEIASLVDRKGRVTVAEELNSAILASLGKSSRSALENVFGQTNVLLDYLREEGGAGSFVSVQSVIDDIPKSQLF